MLTCYRQHKTGLPISTYFSAVKLKWLMDNVEEVHRAVISKRAMFGTVDSWIIWVRGRDPHTPPHTPPHTSKRADPILSCDVNRPLATDRPECDATGPVVMSATSVPDTRHL